MRSGTLKVSAEPIELARNMAEPRSMTRSRPQRSASAPAMIAPSAQPSRATATTNPVSRASFVYVDSIEETAPLMTEESKPNRNPPTAAATDSAAALRPYGLFIENVPAGSESVEVTRKTIAPPGATGAALAECALRVVGRIRLRRGQRYGTRWNRPSNSDW